MQNHPCSFVLTFRLAIMSGGPNSGHPYVSQPPTLPAPNQGYPQQQQPFDTTGQIAPPGMKPRVTATLWEDEGSLCFQVEAKGVCVARREGMLKFNLGRRVLMMAQIIISLTARSYSM
jgi:enhanced filamentous growth protein 1